MLLELFSRKGKHIKTFTLWWSLGSVLRPKNHLSPWTQWRGVTGSTQDECSYPFIYSSVYTNLDFLHHTILEALKVLPPLTVCYTTCCPIEQTARHLKTWCRHALKNAAVAVSPNHDRICRQHPTVLQAEGICINRISEQTFKKWAWNSKLFKAHIDIHTSHIQHMTNNITIHLAVQKWVFYV